MNPNKTKQVKLSVLLDKLTELGWDYTCGRMSRSVMQIYDEIMPVSYTHLTLPPKRIV